MGAKERGRRDARGEARASASGYSRVRLVVTVAIAFVVLFAIVVALKISRDYRDSLIAAERDLAATASSLSAQLTARLGELDSLLDEAATTWLADGARQGSPTAASLSALSERIKATPAASDLVVFGAGGLPLYRVGGRIDGVPADWSTERFLAAFGTSEERVVVADGSDVLLLRKIGDNDGKITAVAVLAMAPDLARQLSHTINFAAAKHIVLASREGAVLDYAPRARPLEGLSVSSLLGLETGAGAEPEVPVIAYARNPAGESILTVSRNVAGTPFHLIVVERLADILSRWTADLVFYGLMILASGLFAAAVATMMVRQAREQRRIIAGGAGSEARFNLTLAGARCGMWDWDLENNRMVWSPSMYAMLGRSEGKHELDPADIRALLHPSDRTLLDSIAADAGKERGEYDEVFRLRHAHGHWIWVHAKGKSYATAGDGPSRRRLLGIALDITQLKQAETRVSQAEAQLRDAIDNISEAFVLWDVQDKLLIYNNNFAAFYQIDPEILKPGARRREAMAAAANPVEVLHVESSASETTKHTSELQHVGERWLHVSTRLTKEGGQVSVCTDVTALKEQESELLKNEQRLKEYVEVLKASEANLRKEATQRAEMALKYGREKTRAEEAARSKTEFLANMSHELRTPLNAIMGFAQIMQDGMFGSLGDDRYRDYTGHILESAQHLLNLINDILDMSKIESGKMQLELGEIDIADLVADCARFIEPKAFEAGLLVKSEVPELPAAYADVRATKQILINLLSNAVKFSQRGGTVTIGGDVDSNHVNLFVADTGIGIAQEDLPRLCKPFEQIESQRNKKHKGSGLGLALAKSLAELQGGTLEVSSQLGLGTTVKVCLLRHPPKAASASAA